ncbi:1-(5-phosphoribosyl)-5-[(5-phosphoribosylamino)methylideneamino]imidazole-4-carboxamide isomerase [Chloroflexota bacterium]
MEIIPAIDLINGKCVRLYQGDYAQETVFSTNPMSLALRWESEGAQRLHLVDLDGAAAGKPCNIAAIDSIAKAVKIPIEVGGGIRTLDTIEQLLNLGARRVILGTAAVEDSDMVREACRKYGEGIVIGIDARDGYVATHGWMQNSALAASKLATEMLSLGAKRFIYTDISRDGTLTEPNFQATADLLSQVTVPVIAAGGISSIEHLTRLATLGVEGAIVGRALYTEHVRLGEAIAAVTAV